MLHYLFLSIKYNIVTTKNNIIVWLQLTNIKLKNKNHYKQKTVCFKVVDYLKRRT